MFLIVGCSIILLTVITVGNVTSNIEINAPTLFRNLQKRSLACSKRGTPQEYYPL